jgi:MoxR-like ATPase
MNEDASTYELPEYIHSRLQPQILIDFPDRQDELQILRENLPFADDKILGYVVDFLQRAHEAEERYSVRDGINVARFALKLLHGGDLGMEDAVRKGVLMILGEEAQVYLD